MLIYFLFSHGNFFVIVMINAKFRKLCISFLTIIIHFILWLLLKVTFDLKEGVLTVPFGGQMLQVLSAFGGRPASARLFGELKGA